MPRRRMIDPFFWSDPKVGRLTRDERALVSGCMGHTDDNGRIEANPAYLKAMIFKYDDDLDIAAVKALRDDCLSKMESWPVNHPYRMKLYSNAGEEYIFFPAFTATNKPSHPTPSQLPAPPPDLLQIFSGVNPDSLTKNNRGAPEALEKPSRLGQSSLGKDRISQVREVQEDFTKFLDNEKDLTDFMTTTLEKYMPLGPPRVMEPIKKLWLQATGQALGSGAWQIIYDSLKKYPVPVLARSLVKAVKYSPGKRKPANYIQTVFVEQMKEYEKEHPP